MRNSPETLRLKKIRNIRGALERDGYPRLQMVMLVSLTGAAGLLVSYLLLDAGLREMWLRYLISMGAAYLVFLMLLWIWLRARSDDGLDISDPGIGPSDPDCVGSYSGKGGGFDGGGASGNYDSGSSVLEFGKDGSKAVDGALDAAAGADELAVPLAVVLLIIAGLVSSLFLVSSVIYSSPLLFAELMVDGMLSASLYRRLRGIDSRHWLETAISRTVWPFLLATVLICAAGWGMSVYAPEAQTVGEVWSYARRTP